MKSEQEFRFVVFVVQLIGFAQAPDHVGDFVDDPGLPRAHFAQPEFALVTRCVGRRRPPRGNRFVFSPSSSADQMQLVCRNDIAPAAVVWADGESVGEGRSSEQHVAVTHPTLGVQVYTGSSFSLKATFICPPGEKPLAAPIVPHATSGQLLCLQDDGLSALAWKIGHGESLERSARKLQLRDSGVPGIAAISSIGIIPEIVGFDDDGTVSMLQIPKSPEETKVVTSARFRPQSMKKEGRRRLVWSNTFHGGGKTRGFGLAIYEEEEEENGESRTVGEGATETKSNRRRSARKRRNSKTSKPQSDPAPTRKHNHPYTLNTFAFSRGGGGGTSSKKSHANAPIRLLNSMTLRPPSLGHIDITSSSGAVPRLEFVGFDLHFGGSMVWQYKVNIPGAAFLYEGGGSPGFVSVKTGKRALGGGSGGGGAASPSSPSASSSNILVNFGRLVYILELPPISSSTTSLPSAAHAGKARGSFSLSTVLGSGAVEASSDVTALAERKYRRSSENKQPGSSSSSSSSSSSKTNVQSLDLCAECRRLQHGEEGGEESKERAEALRVLDAAVACVADYNERQLVVALQYALGLLRQGADEHLLNSILVTSFSSRFMRGALRLLNRDDVLLLLGYLVSLMDIYSHSEEKQIQENYSARKDSQKVQSSKSAKNLLPSSDKICEWLNVVLNAHMLLIATDQRASLLLEKCFEVLKNYLSIKPTELSGILQLIDRLRKQSSMKIEAEVPRPLPESELIVVSWTSDIQWSWSSLGSRGL
eukprot:jgi/Bigna1/72263/fgenesh1_pg.19_\